MMSHVYIFGPFNSGTNLIMKIITLMPINNVIVNEENVWKHTIKSPEIQQIIDNKNNIVIFMYKNVYNWLYSIKKCSYDIVFSNMYSEVGLYSKKFANMIELYNFYYINSKLQKINLQIISKDKIITELSKPSKNHGAPINSATDAKNNYKNNNEMVKQFVEKIPVLNKSVKSSIINYFENT